MSARDKEFVTEQRNPASSQIDNLSTREILEVINREDARVAEAVKEESSCIARAVDLIFSRFREGGRLFYLGAGTSGRLGVLDVVECAPTFSLEEGRLIAILAGGREAMFNSREGEEDDETAGAEKIENFEVSAEDAVMGITASGRTPFVLGALRLAREKGALTVGMACNRGTPVEKETDVAITPVVGPEVLTGSTRMKAGTAQKMVLNMMSTALMIKMGKVYSNLMVDLQPKNSKLRERSCRIFTDITGAGIEEAEKYLQASEFRLKEAIIMYEKGVDLLEAKILLEQNNGILRRIIG